MLLTVDNWLVIRCIANLLDLKRILYGSSQVFRRPLGTLVLMYFRA